MRYDITEIQDAAYSSNIFWWQVIMLYNAQYLTLQMHVY